MRLLIIYTAFAALALVAARDCRAQGPAIETGENEIVLDAVVLQQVVEGVPLSFPTSATLSFEKVGAALMLRVRALVDLSDLQRQVGRLVATVPLPRDNCAHQGPGNFVVGISSSDLKGRGSLGVLTLNVRARQWTCQDTFLGRALLAIPPDRDAEVEVRLPFELVRRDSQTLAVEVKEPELAGGGGFERFIVSLLGIVGVDAGGRLRAEITKAIDPSLLKTSFPAELAILHPEIASATLLTSPGGLAARLELTARIDPDTIEELAASQ